MSQTAEERLADIRAMFDDMDIDEHLRVDRMSGFIDDWFASASRLKRRSRRVLAEHIRRRADRLMDQR